MRLKLPLPKDLPHTIQERALLVADLVHAILTARALTSQQPMRRLLAEPLSISLGIGLLLFLVYALVGARRYRR